MHEICIVSNPENMLLFFCTTTLILLLVKRLGFDYHMGPQVHIREPGGSLSVTHEIRMLGYEKRGRDH